MRQYALIPRYMEKFRCIGSDCEDTCCAYWGITVDKDSYDKYMSIGDPGWRKRFKEHVHKRDENASTRQYATMQLNTKTGACSMLRDGLCSIHADLGESYLCGTCATYPRKVNTLNQIQEMSATPSCPEAARLMLLEPGGIDFIQIEPLSSNNIQVDQRLNFQTEMLSNYFWDMRMTAIEILQNRQFSFEHRLLILGLLCEQIAELTKSGDFSLVQERIAAFQTQISPNTEIGDFEIFPTNEHFQLQILNKLIMSRVEKHIWNRRYKECLDDYIEGMKAEGEEPATIAEQYAALYRDHYKPFMDKHEYIFENYMVNALYSSMFPVHPKYNVFDQILMFAVNYAVVKLHLIGMSGRHNGLTHELAVKLIQSFSKNYEHNNAYVNSVYELLKKEQYDTIGHMSLFVKNSA